MIKCWLMAAHELTQKQLATRTHNIDSMTTLPESFHKELLFSI